MTALHVGLIGCGRMGARRAATVARHPRTALVVVTDVDRWRAEEVAARSGGADIAWSVADLVARPDVDTVIVSTPNSFHRAHAIEALEHGKHVICEKPLACTTTDAAAVVAAARANGVTVKMGSNLRFFANVRKAKELLDAGSIGEPLSLRGWIGNDGWAAASWYGDRALSGGGTVLDNGCHLFDLVRLFLGEVETCVGTTSSTYWRTGVEDNGCGVFTTANGKSAVIQSSWTEWTPYFSFDVHGTGGVLTVDNRLPVERVTLNCRSGATDVFDFADARADTYQDEFDAYVLARSTGRPPEPTGEDGLRVVAMAAAIYRSAELGRSVRVAEHGAIPG
jgi:predicted dehydrogenase